MVTVGIDVGKVLFDPGTQQEAKLHQFKNSPAGIAKLIRDLRRLEGVRVLVEATGGHEEAVFAACVASGL